MTAGSASTCGRGGRPSVLLVTRYVPFGTEGTDRYVRDIVAYLSERGCDMYCAFLGPHSKALHVMPRRSLIRRVFARELVRVGRVSVCRAMAAARTRRMVANAGRRVLPGRAVRLAKRLVDPARHGGPHAETPVITQTPASFPDRDEIAFVSQVVREVRPDVMLANYLFTAPCFRAAESGTLKVILAHDIQHKRAEALSAMGYREFCGEMTPEVETQHLRMADLIVAIQPDDAASLAELAHPVPVICGPKAAQITGRRRAPIAGRCLLVAAMHPTAVQGIEWMLREVWPAVRTARPDATLHICGTVTAALAGRSDPGLVLRGFVRDLGREYSTAALCVIPLLTGSGLKIKLVEALAHGVPCVSTSVGVQGVAEWLPGAVLVEDSAASFASAVMRLLHDAGAQARMSQQALNVARERFGADVCYGPLLAALLQANESTRCSVQG